MHREPGSGIRVRLCALRLLVLALTACTAGAPGSGIDTPRALQHVAELVAIGPRPGDSPAAQRAAAYIEQALATAGLRAERVPVGSVELPAIDIPLFHRSMRRVDTKDPDLVVRLGPPGKALLVMAHYDTVQESRGAVDNAAAVGIVIELARVLAASPPKQPVILMLTANEEIGLVGAEAFAEHHAGEVDFAIALDLVGASGPLVLNGASELIGRRELDWIADAADRAGVVVRAPLPQRVISRAWPEIERSDHGAFTRRGVRAVHFYDHGQDGEWIDLAYHSPHDTLERVDRDSVDELGRLLVALAQAPPPPHDGDGFWVPLAINTVIPRWIVVAFDAALAALALGLLATLRRSRERGGIGLLVGIPCFVAAVGVTAVLERLTAGGHPAPWLHAPLAAELAEAAVLFGGFGIAVQAVRRFGPWVGDRRYLAIAITLPLAIGLAILLAGAAELAWIWLVPAAIAALAPRLGRAGVLAPVVALLPGVLVLIPNQLREAAWNGFLPIGIPLGVWLAVFLIAPLAALAWWVRNRPTSHVMGTLVLRVGCPLAILAGVLGLLREDPPCTPSEFQESSLACEAPWIVHPGLH